MHSPPASEMSKDEYDAKLHKFAQDGTGVKGAALALGVSRDVVYWWARKNQVSFISGMHGIKVRKLSPSERDDYKTLREDGGYPAEEALAKVIASRTPRRISMYIRTNHNPS